MKNIFLLIMGLVINTSFAQKLKTFIHVEDIEVKNKIEESVFIACKLVNNSESEIKIPKRFIANDYLNSTNGVDEIGAIVCKKNKKDRYEKIRIKKDVHASTNIEYIKILPKSEAFFHTEFIYSDLFRSGTYKIKLILKIGYIGKSGEMEYKKIYSNWFYVKKQ